MRPLPLDPTPFQVPAGGAAGPSHPTVGLSRSCHGDGGPPLGRPPEGSPGPPTPTGPPDPRRRHPAPLPPRAGGWGTPPRGSGEPLLGGLGLSSWQLGCLGGGGLRPVAMATRGVGDPPLGA